MLGGGAVGTLGGLIGLGGAEFRLPLLIGPFGFGALDAVILNKAMSLVVVASALPLRFGAVPLGAVLEHWPVILNLLAGSVAGAWFGAGWATRLRSTTLYKVIAACLMLIAFVLLLGHSGSGAPLLTGPAQFAAGVVAGFGIGVVASLLGVAGGELLIPTLVLLYGVDLKLAGSLSLAVSLPTMVAGFLRYSQDRSFAVLGRNWRFALLMAAGSMAGSFIGARILLGLMPDEVLLPLLALILLLSAVKVWMHAASAAKPVAGCS